MTRAVALALLLLSACPAARDSRAPSRPVSLVLPALDGGAINIASYRGRVVVLHFFATWDTVSTLDVDQLRAAAGDAEVIGVALDVNGRVLVAPWRDAMGVRYLIALATPAIQAGQTALGRIDKVPTTIVLDRHGVEIARVERGLAPKELSKLIARARDRR